MKLNAWIQLQIDAGHARTKTEALRALEKAIIKQGGETVSFVTLQNTEGGKLLRKFPKAKAIEKATGGRVTVTELCQ